jgi:hypothetical protein
MSNNKDNLIIIHEIINELNLEISKYFPDDYMRIKFKFLKYESNGFDFNIKLFDTFLILDDYVDIVEITIDKERFKNDIKDRINKYLEIIRGVKL